MIALGRRSWRLNAAAVLSAIVLSILMVPAAHAETTSTVTEVLLARPSAGTKRAPATFTVTTTTGVAGSTAPVAGVHVVLEGLSGTTWSTVAEGVTDEAGQAKLTTTLDDRAIQSFRSRTTPAEGEGDPVASTPVDVTATNQHGPISVRLASSVKDGASLPLTISWSTSTGLPIPGVVQVHHLEQGRWTISTLRLSPAGRATMKVTPRWDSTWYVTGGAGTWYDAARSAAHAVDNIPPGRPAAYPRAAPAPRVTMPAQPRATTSGAHPVITKIPTKVWRTMVGISWHRGCPVGRPGLRFLRINYWGFDGYRHQGQLIASTRAIKKFKAALVDLYKRRYPIRSMYLVDVFGYSPSTGGADDFTSMAADNTSAFNCRRVDHAPNLSPHSRGTAIDVNTWENPYHSAKGLVPNTWWQSRRWAPITARKRSDLLVRIFARHGARWTYGLTDTQHFDA